MNDEDRIIVHIDADLEPIIPRFFELRKEDVDSIKKSLKKGDYETMRRSGHSMKGSGGGYGFDYISELGKGIENAAIEENSKEIEQRVNELSKYLKKVEVIYDE